MKKENLTPEESLQIITQTIQEAKEQVQKHSWNLIMWGALISTSAILCYLFVNHWELSLWSWLPWGISMPAGFIISLVVPVKAKTKLNYIGRMAMKIGIFNGITMMSVGFGFLPFFAPNWSLFTAVMIVLTSIVCYLNAILLRFNFLAVTAVLSLIVAFGTLWLPSKYSMLAMAVVSMMLFLIPGWVLWRKEKKNG